MKRDPTYEDIMSKFESMGKVESRTSRNNNSRFSWTGFCILFALAVGLVVVSISYVSQVVPISLSNSDSFASAKNF